jgi:hypothetical protein
LAGRDVVILPDNDPAGMKYAETVAGILLRLNAKVRIVALPGLPDGGDLVDYVDDSEAEDVETIKGNIVALAEEAEPVKDIPQPAPAVTDARRRADPPGPRAVLPELCRSVSSAQRRTLLQFGAGREDER